MKNKIQSLPYISSILKKARINKKIILSHGVFDLLHAGHIKHLEKAKSLGDVLIVSITSDNHVNKGPGRPIFNERIRAESLGAIGVVDYVVINNKTAINPLK